ncbi:hypothetical protein GCM10007148_19820 [Parvularcula lutaonensis]|nr:hypothetical protein GCM10007148_19820 [Parvularcula lutaonensis]
MAAGVPSGAPSVEEAAARRFWGGALRLWRPRLTREPVANVPEITNQIARLLAEGLPPGDLAMETPLRVAALTGWPLPCSALALPREDAPDWQAAFVTGLAEEARQSLLRLQALERDFGRWRSLLPPTRSDSRLEEAVVLLGTVHALTPRYVGQTLGLTRQAAARLCKRLEGLGIVRKATSRKRWLVYLAENATSLQAVRENTTDIPTGAAVDVEEIDRVLESAYAALDRSVKRDDA